MSRLNAFQQTRDALFTWAARAHPKQLRAGVDLYFGDGRRTEEAAHGAVAFGLQLPDADGTALFERYAAAHPNLPRAQREAIYAWRGARFGLYEVREVELDRGFHLLDVVAERTFFVHERSGTRQVPAGEWLFALVIERGDHLELEGTLGLVPGPARIHAVQAALRAYDGRTDVDAATSRRALGPVMAALHEARRPPRLANTDGHDILLLTSTLDRPWDEIEAVVSAWPGVETATDPDGREQLLLVADTPHSHEALGGPAVRATFTRVGAGTELFVNSRERHDAVLARLAAAGLPVRAETVKELAPPSNPNGSIAYVDAASVPADELDPDDPAEAFHARQRRDWPDVAIPALDGLTPREALAQGRRAEVRALLPEGSDALAAELGL